MVIPLGIHLVKLQASNLCQNCDVKYSCFFPTPQADSRSLTTHIDMDWKQLLCLWPDSQWWRPEWQMKGQILDQERRQNSSSTHGSRLILPSIDLCPFAGVFVKPEGMAMLAQDKILHLLFVAVLVSVVATSEGWRHANTCTIFTYSGPVT